MLELILADSGDRERADRRLRSVQHEGGLTMAAEKHAWLTRFTVAVDLPIHLTYAMIDEFRNALWSATLPYSHRLEGPDRDNVLHIFFRPTVQGDMADPKEMVDRVGEVFEQWDTWRKP